MDQPRKDSRTPAPSSPTLNKLLAQLDSRATSAALVALAGFLELATSRTPNIKEPD